MWRGCGIKWDVHDCARTDHLADIVNIFDTDTGSLWFANCRDVILMQTYQKAIFIDNS
jgi:hypothetical protein